MSVFSANKYASEFILASLCKLTKMNSAAYLYLYVYL